MIKSSIVRLRLLSSNLDLWQSELSPNQKKAQRFICFVVFCFVAAPYGARFADSWDGVCTKTYPRIADQKQVQSQYTCGWFGVEK